MKIFPNMRRNVGRQLGFSLIEGLISIALFSFGVLAIMNLQAQSIQSGGESKYRIDASFLANQLIGQMWTDRGNLASYANAAYIHRYNWGKAVGATLPSGNAIVAVNASRVTITVTWQSPGQAMRQYVTVADINGS
jgi:type IV pilus assembly protein PilV